MVKFWVPIIVASSLFALSGCGGSSVSSASLPEAGGAPLQQFQATLPDGSDMEIEILGNDSSGWSGDFAVSAETGPYAYQTGSFDGSIVGSSVNATCELVDGTAFQLTGTVNSSTSLSLMRSDIPGVTLNFQLVVPTGPKKLGTVSFSMNTNGSTGRCVLSDSAYSTGGGMTEYRGTWLGLNVTFWSYSTGYATIVTYINDYAINSANFTSYRLTDLGTLSFTSASSQISVYSAAIKSQIKYKTTVQVSPG